MIIEEKSEQTKVSAEETAKEIYISLLRKGNPVFLNTSGSSMYPFLKGGDIIKVMPVKEEDIKIGDILAVTNEEKSQPWFCAHRLVRIFTKESQRSYITKGDANIEGKDEPVGSDRIAGRVIEIERNGLSIDLEASFWRRLNARIAEESFRYPRRLRALAPWISLIIEWRWLLSKVRRRINKPLYNTEELLLICARTNIDRGLVSRAKDLLSEGVMWDLFMETALKSGLPYLFYNSLKKIDYPKAIPQELMNNLKNGYLCMVASITFRYEEAKEVLRLFFENNIPAVPLKGPFLSRRIYGDIAIRGLSADFDLLVEEKDVEAAKKILTEAGYCFAHEYGMEWTKQSAFTKAGAVAIELHWSIRPDAPSSERMKGFWQGVMPKDEDGVSYFEVREEELLILLSAHLVGSKHFGQLRYICDINEILTKYSNTLDWQEIIEKAKKWKLSNSVYTTLLLSKTLFQTYMPGEALLKLRPGLAKRFFIRITANRNAVLRAGSLERNFMNRFLKYILLQVLEAGSLKDFIDIIFPNKYTMGGKTYVKRLYGGFSKLMTIFKKR